MGLRCFAKVTVDSTENNNNSNNNNNDNNSNNNNNSIHKPKFHAVFDLQCSQSLCRIYLVGTPPGEVIPLDELSLSVHVK